MLSRATVPTRKFPSPPSDSRSSPPPPRREPGPERLEVVPVAADLDPPLGDRLVPDHRPPDRLGRRHDSVGGKRLPAVEPAVDRLVVDGREVGVVAGDDLGRRAGEDSRGEADEARGRTGGSGRRRPAPGAGAGPAGPPRAASGGGPPRRARRTTPSPSRGSCIPLRGPIEATRWRNRARSWFAATPFSHGFGQGRSVRCRTVITGLPPRGLPRGSARRNVRTPRRSPHARSGGAG